MSLCTVALFVKMLHLLHSLDNTLSSVRFLCTLQEKMALITRAKLEGMRIGQEKRFKILTTVGLYNYFLRPCTKKISTVFYRCFSTCMGRKGEWSRNKLLGEVKFSIQLPPPPQKKILRTPLPFSICYTHTNILNIRIRFLQDKRLSKYKEHTALFNHISSN